MKDFTHYINIGGEKFQLHFTKVFSPTSDKYFVVATGEKVVVTFDMKSNGFAQWVIVPPAPEWILSEQTRLSHFIEATIRK